MTFRITDSRVEHCCSPCAFLGGLCRSPLGIPENAPAGTPLWLLIAIPPAMCDCDYNPACDCDGRFSCDYRSCRARNAAQ
eukprot:14097433-Alexandrium_andersonii.AAC.1